MERGQTGRTVELGCSAARTGHVGSSVGFGRSIFRLERGALAHVNNALVSDMCTT